MPFRHINALTDVASNELYVSYLADPECVMSDELAHLMSGSPNHDKRWEQAAIDINGKVPDHNPEFDRLKRRLGIPNNIAANIGNITGIQNILLDYHMLQAYRRFSQRILGTEGHWEVLGDNQIRLYPTPRGSFPVVVEYTPPVYRFRSPEAKELTKRCLVAELKIMVGNARSKFGSIPGPDGGSIQLNGDALRTEGQEEKKKVEEDAILLGEPLGIYKY